MFKISFLFLFCVILALISDKETEEIRRNGYHYSVRSDGAYLLLVLVLILFSGLRTNYNDTWNYIDGFRKAPGLSEFLADPENLNPFTNPLFYFLQSLLKTLFNNAQILIFISSAVTQTLFVLFFKRYSRNFAFSIFLYFTLGTFTVSLGALKQVLAMAILTLSIPCLEKKQWIRFFLIVFIAMLIHTYAVSFVVLPFFTRKPWKFFTYAFVIVMVITMMNFEEVITGFMEQANELGKTLEDYEVFHSHTINLFRLAVYAATPLVSFLFQRWAFNQSSTDMHVMTHMSIISLAFMCMGTQSGANMFGRMAHYFEIGTICCLPWILEKTFEKRSYRLISGITAVCFLLFFIYANGINMQFDDAYKATSIFSLFGF